MSPHVHPSVPTAPSVADVPCRSAVCYVSITPNPLIRALLVFVTYCIYRIIAYGEVFALPQVFSLYSHPVAATLAGFPFPCFNAHFQVPHWRKVTEMANLKFFILTEGVLS